MRERRPVRYQREEEALKIGKLRLMLIERLLAVFGLLATTALMLLGLRAEAITVGTASAALAASSRRP